LAFALPYDDLVAIEIEIFDAQLETLLQPDPDPYNSMTISRAVPVSCFRRAPISSRLSTTGNRSGVRARTTGGTLPISTSNTSS